MKKQDNISELESCFKGLSGNIEQIGNAMRMARKAIIYFCDSLGEYHKFAYPFNVRVGRKRHKNKR